jgi:hypothetical protein
MKRAGIAFFAVIMAFGTVTVGLARASQKQPSSTSGECNQPPPPPMPPASDFVAGVDNKYFPLVPGTVFVYRGTEGGDRVLDKVVVTDLTKTILGVRVTVVLDSVDLNGQPSEKTLDWYAQDKQGNVWYMGEAAFEFVHGHWMRAADSWEAGRHGAQPGIIMEAHSKVGDTYRQEFYPGHAEDTATVLSTHASISVPYGSFHHVLKTNECTPLEPGVLDVKFYAKGVGEVFEATVRGGSAKLALVSVRST